MSSEFDRKVFVRDLKEEFHLTQITGNDDSLNRWIIAPDVNRPGLELTGNMRETDLKRVNLIGNKELAFIKTLDENTQRERFDSITDGFTPCIIITSGNKTPEILKNLAIQKNFPIFETDESTFRVVVQVIAYLDEKLAPTESFHGVMMNIYGVGVMLQGKSGIGKSELALDLIQRGHMLVADDRVDISRVHNDLICRSPELLKNMLEIRGVGVIDVSMAFGSTSTLDESYLDFVIELVPFDATKINDRIGVEDNPTVSILGVDRPLVKIPVKEGRAMGAIIESAVANFRLLEKGIDSAKIFDKRVVEYIEKNKE